MFFDPTNIFSFEKYFQVQVKSHEIHSTAFDPVLEWRIIHAFMKVIKFTQLQDDYGCINDGARYQNFTALYNKMN